MSSGGKQAKFDPHTVGWSPGRTDIPKRVPVWIPWDRSTGVEGMPGSGKTLDLLSPQLMAHDGPAMVTGTKPEDLYLTFGPRTAPDPVSGRARPAAVLDPWGLAPGCPELIMDILDGCVDPMTAARRALAFGSGTVNRGAQQHGDDGARFYREQCALVLRGYFHAAALTGRTLDDVLEWVAQPVATASEPISILTQHPGAAPGWVGYLRGALHGDSRTVNNTVATIQQAMGLFSQPAIRARCVPGPGRPATNIRQVIAEGGTLYLLGRDDPYVSVAPLMAAVAEHILDCAEDLAHESPKGRLTPTFLALLDELPSIAPIMTLATRLANDRALGLSFTWAAQNQRQMEIVYGRELANTILRLTNNLFIFGGSNDGDFNREMSDLIGAVRVSRSSSTTGGGQYSRTRSTEDEAVITADEIRRIGDRHALLVSERLRPVIVKLDRCIDGKAGAALLAGQARLRDLAEANRSTQRVSIEDLTRRAHAEARARLLYRGSGDDTATIESGGSL